MGILQPCILLQLVDGDAHGYAILEGLGEYIHDAGSYDSSVIYRAMKEMEAKGWLESYSGEASLGPRRKMVCITDEGKAQLHVWIQDLKRSRSEIDRLLAGYESKLPDLNKEKEDA